MVGQSQFDQNQKSNLFKTNKSNQYRYELAHIENFFRIEKSPAVVEMNAKGGMKLADRKQFVQNFVNMNTIDSIKLIIYQMK